MKFLEQIVAAYTADAEIDNLARRCFVFPTRRSLLFFRQYLIEELTRKGRVSFLPALTTLENLVGRFTDTVKASSTELLFILYNTYRDLCRRRGMDEADILEFDRFRFWGEMVISDFDDIDRNLADTHQILRNVSSLKEIAVTDFLTPEQQEVVDHYFRTDSAEADRRERYESNERFWRHVLHDGGEGEADPESVKSKFISLWALLEDLYTDFQVALRSAGLHYPGMTWRRGAEALRYPRAAGLPFERYVFCGFDILSASELYVMEHMRDAGMADFYWDLASPALYKSEGELNDANRGGRTVGLNARMFPSMYPLQPVEMTSLPDVDVVEVASGVGQTKTAGSVLSAWAAEGKVTDCGNAIDTAVVLTDESMLIPMLHSLPEAYTSVNVTLGLPVRHTPEAALVGALTSLQLRSRSVHDVDCFFHEDVISVLSQPMIQRLAPERASKMLETVRRQRRFYVDAQMLADFDEALAVVWRRVIDINSPSEVSAWFRGVLTAVRNAGDDYTVVDSMVENIDEFMAMVDKYGIDMRERTFIHLLERQLLHGKLIYSGEPLRGLQVMTIEQADALDFRNIVVLSLNERIYPRRRYGRTFIPNALRRAYGLPTIDEADAKASYRFFRLLGRAQNAVLCYDGRTGGLISGEPSRYLRQLDHIPCYEPVLKHYSVTSSAMAPEQRMVSVNKREEDINRFRQGGDLSISPSALKAYMKCPLNFYLGYVKNWREDKDPVDYMDEAEYGTVVHAVMQDTYDYLVKRFGSPEEGVGVSADMLEQVPKMSLPGDDMKLLPRLALRAINREFNHLDEQNQDRRLDIDLQILADTVVHFAKLILERDKAFTPFTYIASEYKHRFYWEELGINFKMVIDRVDRTDGGLRFVDYKTGTDELKATNVDAIFNKSECSAIFQLIAYCEGASASGLPSLPSAGRLDHIQPLIYKISEMTASPVTPIIVGSEPLMDYADVSDRFMPRLKELVAEILNPDVPFIQAKSDSACKFCVFNELCGRNTDND